jgi:hypothetical protein
VLAVTVPVHTPEVLHASFTVHAFPSSQALPAVRACVTTPVDVLQASTVHWLPSSTATAAPTHRPEALHTSPTVHAFPSSQETPGVGVCTHA